MFVVRFLFFVFLLLFFFFHVYSVLNDYIFLEKKEEKLNRTGCGKAFLGSGI